MTRKMTREKLTKRDLHYTATDGSRVRWDLTNKEGSLIQIFNDYLGWYLVSGTPDLKDDLRWSPANRYSRTSVQFLPGDIVMYLGFVRNRQKLWVGWNYRLLWKEIVVESGTVFPPPSAFFAMGDVELFSPGAEPWDCTELFEEETRYRRGHGRW